MFRGVSCAQPRDSMFGKGFVRDENFRLAGMTLEELRSLYRKQLDAELDFWSKSGTACWIRPSPSMFPPDTKGSIRTSRVKMLLGIIGTNSPKVLIASPSFIR